MSRSQSVDHEAIEELRARMTIARSSMMTERSCILAAQVQRYLGNYSQAREHVRDAIQINPISLGALSVQGWIDLYEFNSDQIVSLFDKILEKSPRDIDVCYRRIRLMNGIGSHGSIGLR